MCHNCWMNDGVVPCDNKHHQHSTGWRSQPPCQHIVSWQYAKVAAVSCLTVTAVSHHSTIHWLHNKRPVTTRNWQILTDKNMITDCQWFVYMTPLESLVPHTLVLKHLVNCNLLAPLSVSKRFVCTEWFNTAKIIVCCHRTWLLCSDQLWCHRQRMITSLLASFTRANLWSSWLLKHEHCLCNDVTFACTNIICQDISKVSINQNKFI